MGRNKRFAGYSGQESYTLIAFIHIISCIASFPGSIFQTSFPMFLFPESFPGLFSSENPSHTVAMYSAL